MDAYRMFLALLLMTCCALARPDNPTEEASVGGGADTENVDMTPKTDIAEDDGQGFVEGENEPIDDFTTIVPPDSGLDPDNATTPNSTTSTTLPPPTTSAQNTTSSSTTSSTSTETPTTSTTSTTTTTTSTETSTSVTPNVTTPAVPVNPDAGKSGGFSGWSFLGGIVLALVGVAISFLSVKYWKIRRAQTGTGGDYNRF